MIQGHNLRFLSMDLSIPPSLIQNSQSWVIFLTLPHPPMPSRENIIHSGLQKYLTIQKYQILKKIAFLMYTQTFC